MNALQNRLNPIFSTDCFSVLCLSFHRPVSGKRSANHAFIVQASEAMTMYARPHALLRDPDRVGEAARLLLTRQRGGARVVRLAVAVAVGLPLA